MTRSSKFPKCRYCGQKLGVAFVVGGFCSFKCKTKWKEEQEKIENMS